MDFPGISFQFHHPTCRAGWNKLAHKLLGLEWRNKSLSFFLRMRKFSARYQRNHRKSQATALWSENIRTTEGQHVFISNGPFPFLAVAGYRIKKNQLGVHNSTLARPMNIKTNFYDQYMQHQPEIPLRSKGNRQKKKKQPSLKFEMEQNLRSKPLW